MQEMKEELQKVFIETYGCQMNVNDSEVVASILKANGYEITEELDQADVVLVNTCSIRENAETRVFGRLDNFKQYKKRKPSLLVGVLGCMAERLKESLLEDQRAVDLVVGPDAYRELPVLLRAAEDGQKSINVLLSREETYADISPVRLDKNGVSAFVSIMRGCNNMCTYCVVPYTRGAERSRDPQTIVREVEELLTEGYREVTLLGQNVDSYRWKQADGSVVSFAELLELVAKVSPSIRVRFSTSHPKDLSNEVLYTMAMYENICNHIHLPAQSGSTRVLKLMNRGYSREYYLERVKAIRAILPDCAISTDIITGFCTETELDHDQTLSLMDEVKYDFAYMFKYSVRPNTKAARKFEDDVPEEVKTRRLTEIIEMQGKLAEESKQKDIGRCFEVLIEGESKKSSNEFFGRTSQNKVVVFPRESYRVGDYVFVEVTSCTPATLIGRIVQE
ncbi:MAG: tRNA (N6-isopentenyl adenosine(37)-C2)-methylthiotransferase MiaB [Bacteroidales bacterium]|nr:tRNA (N6-isopentenyl adenosine(37)-C2)-methylthiotransferase MiaB [Bacteroidales bacterium]MBN2749763.1 tRNA (N6-isopentenyl adenosine(37)-C2)-methylthiotransferase MiaB [Bacteroidales bacterium]